MAETYYLPDPSQDERYPHRSRPLIRALIVSVFLNVGFIVMFTFFLLKERKPETVQISQVKKKFTETNSEILKHYLDHSFNELVHELENETVIEQGFRCCDLALACLVALYHFDLERALPGLNFQKRPFVFHPDGGEEISVHLVPGIEPEHFETLKYFAKSEAWPLTPEGLFEEMKHRGGQIPESLKETFFLSQEFYLIERAFSRLSIRLSKEMLLHFLLEGSWNQIAAIATDIQSSSERAISNLGPFLAGYDSQIAAYLLAALEPDYAYNLLSDEKLKRVVEKLTQPTQEAEKLLKRIVGSMRSDAVRDQAKTQLLAWGNGELPAISSQKRHVVQKGDSLWNLSRQFKVQIDEIRKINDLASDRLKPGQILIIP